jgi:2-polyprenyl-6-methoxyphenol hydroxylase-like FAD-dependent oxidoreductase
MANRDSDKEVVILGGGPAGLAAGIALRQRGIGCLVVEARLPTIDKGCGEGLLPDAITALRELGISLADGDGHRLRGIRFVSRAHELEARFPNGTGIGVRRTRFIG